MAGRPSALDRFLPDRLGRVKVSTAGQRRQRMAVTIERPCSDGPIGVRGQVGRQPAHGARGGPGACSSRAGGRTCHSSPSSTSTSAFCSASAPCRPRKRSGDLPREVLDRQELADPAAAERAVTAFAGYYDYHRLHGELDWQTPAERFDETPITDRGFGSIPALAGVAALSMGSSPPEQPVSSSPGIHFGQVRPLTPRSLAQAG